MLEEEALSEVLLFANDELFVAEVLDLVACVSDLVLKYVLIEELLSRSWSEFVFWNLLLWGRVESGHQPEPNFVINDSFNKSKVAHVKSLLQSHPLVLFQLDLLTLVLIDAWHLFLLDQIYFPAKDKTQAFDGFFNMDLLEGLNVNESFYVFWACDWEYAEMLASFRKIDTLVH